MEYFAQQRKEPSAVPTGTVTFLFTDIEGSTRILEQLKERYANVLDEQRKILRECFSRWNGHEVDTQGDSFFVAFPRAVDAVSCVIEAQRNLFAHTWPERVSVRVRMGLHTGEPILAKTGYVGMDVHRAARIAAAGYGGQVLLSQTTRDLVYQDLPSGAILRDLGAHKLKDIRYPQTIFQLEIEGLPGDFPALKSLTTEDDPPTPGEAPYKGLQYFNVADASLFFGRSQMIGRLATSVANERFLALIGASGSGKSSVVRAGLIPALTKGQFGAWQIVMFTPTAHPLEAAALALTRAEESVTAAATLQDDLWREPRSLYLYARRTQTQFAKAFLLVVDQFEELFTLCRDPAERQAFIDALLLAAKTPNGPMHILITLRADFYEHLAEWTYLREAVAASQVYLGAMNAEELRLAIEEPARLGGWEFAPGLVELMLHEVGADEGRQPEPGALPLLSHALLETWKHRRANLMTLRAYTESGGVRKAIARTAETLYAQELTPSQQGIARNIFLRLTELGEGTQDTRRRAAIQEFFPSSSHTNPHDVEEVLVKLADARLIITGEGTAEVAHEALIREWPTLRDWLAQDREAMRLHRHLSEAAESWHLLAQDPGALYRGARLVQVQEWAQANPHQLNYQEQAFLDASRDVVEREEAEREAARQRELKAIQLLADEQEQRADEQSRAAKKFKQLALALVGVVVLTLALAGAALFFSQQASINGRIAEQESITARSRELAAAAVAQLNSDPERSILLALQAIDTTGSSGKPALLEAQDALHRALQTSRIEQTWRGSTAAINGLAVSSDGAHVATAGNDGHLILWLYPTGEQVLNINTTAPPNNFSRFISFSPDGEHIAAPAEDNLARVWDVASGEPLLTLTGHTEVVSAVTYSSSGTLLATASMDRLVKVWNAENGKQLLNLEGHTDRVNSVDFSPDGRLLASAGNDGLIILWDTATGKPEKILENDDSIISVAFSPDGTRLAAGHANTVWSLWDIQTGERLFFAYGHSSLVNQIVFDASGIQVATAGSDGTARLWDAQTGRELLNLTGHTSAVMGVAFTQGDQKLITTGYDKTIKIWDISTSAGREWFNLADHTDRVYAVAFSPDGKWIATAGVEGVTKLWDATSGELVKTIPGGNDGVWAVSFSPDGTILWIADSDTVRGEAVTAWDMTVGEQSLQITCDGCERIATSPDGLRLAASIGEEGNAKIWDAQTGKELRLLTGQTAFIQGLDFSPDGKRLATASEDGTVWVWDVLTGRVLLKLTGEGSRFRIDFSPDGKLLAGTGNDSMVTVWDATTGQELYKLTGHTGPTFGVAFSPDGRSLATSSVDRTVKIWNVAAGANAQPLTLFGHTAAIYAVAFSPDGFRLTTASRDGTSHVYALRVEDLETIAEGRVTRTLTLEECRTFLHLDTCPGGTE
jgi:WD40 repeat protein/class 3 adenylate cyclase